MSWLSKHIKFQYTIRIDAAFYQRTYTVIRPSDTLADAEKDRSDSVKMIQDTITSGNHILQIGDDIFDLGKVLHISISEIQEVVKEIEAT